MIKKILCIEDDRFIGEMYQRSLEKSGYEVDWVINGQEGLDKAISQPYDLIILDIILPEMYGTDILQKIAKHFEGSVRPKIIVLTNFDQEEQDRAIMEEHSEAYYIKAEITPRKLLSAISSLEPLAIGKTVTGQ